MTKKEVLIAKENEIAEGKSKKFTLTRGGEKLEGFVVRRKKALYAYLNRCAHVSLPLDWGDNDFFTGDGKFLLCKNHGALYLPKTGECVAGPCAGKSLERIPIEVKSGKIYLK